MSWIDQVSQLMPEPKSVRQLQSFGFIVAAGFTVVGFWPVVFRGRNVRMWPVILAVTLLIPAMLRPSALRPLFRIWMLAGHALGWVNTRIILSVMFFVVFTPIAVLMRMMGRDSMARNPGLNVTSYRRPKAARPASHFRHQF